MLREMDKEVGMEPAEKLLEKKPITHVILSIEAEWITQVREKLEKLGCQVNSIGGEEYQIEFPVGTIEETYAGQSTQWTYRTTIRFPDRNTIQKSVLAPINNEQKERTILTFPKA